MRCLFCEESGVQSHSFPNIQEMCSHLREEHGIDYEVYTRLFNVVGTKRSEGVTNVPIMDVPERVSLVAEILSSPDPDWLIGTMQEHVHADPSLEEHIPQTGPISWNLEILRRLTLAVVSGTPIYIWGPKGTSKTYTIQQVAARIGQPLVRINGVGDMRTSHFIGRVAGKDGTTYWQEGLLPRAMRGGAWFLVDEVDIAPPHILNILQSVLDSRELTQTDTGEKVVAHPSFRIMFTANTSGRGDFSGGYEGTRPLNEAFLDRIGIWVKVSDLEFNWVFDVLVAHMPDMPKGLLSKCAEFFNKLSVSMNQQGVGTTISLRTMINLARYGVSLTLTSRSKLSEAMRIAMDMVFLDSIADPVEHSAINMLVDSLIGTLDEG